MNHHTNNLDLSRQQKQQQKPAQETRKADGFGAKAEAVEWAEIPKGYVVRQGHAITAKPVRDIGPKDREIVQLAIQSFGYLLPLPRAIQTLAGFAALIELACANPKARQVADTLHRLSA